MAENDSLLRTWPYPIVVLQQSKVIYFPIAKNGTSSLMTMMQQLSRPNDRPRFIENPHDLAGTGMLLADLLDAEKREVLDDPTGFKFVVLRDPFDRLASAYIDKFVLTRLASENVHSPPVVGALRGQPDPTPETLSHGISFSEFVAYIVERPSETLDGHWRRQSDYVADLKGLRFYSIDGFDLLAYDLCHYIGLEVEIPLRNQTARCDAIALAEDLSNEMPDVLETLDGLIKDRLYTPELRTAVANYFADDLELFERVQREAAARRSRLEEQGVDLGSYVTSKPYMPRRRLRKALTMNGIRRLLGLTV
ncbi:MAG: sulfotransferase family 2 domain-containing protein [Pseudomonadota bacterium]